MGSALNLTVTHSASSAEAVSRIDCAFTGTTGHFRSFLGVTVAIGIHSANPFQASAAKCLEVPVALKAVGNEALDCRAATERGTQADEVFGRVRDQVFSIEVSTDDRNLSKEQLRLRARTIADHVAGSLF